ncbi:RNA polymerase sigma-70 factor [Pseudopedobacter beijingensis]|uniref:RNA polymerase sigma-70 factor n=1 Tax=Pseudopedobacter beijingensis TaxID=1207056 RepID=A0ABW4I7R1_9SPHI
MTDLDLLEAISLDNEVAFRTLFERYSSRIYSKAFSYIKDQEVCEQIVHDIFLGLWKNRKTLKILVFKNYISAATRYRVYKYLSIKKSSKTDFLEDTTANNKSVLNAGYENLSYKQLEIQIEQLLNDLPPRCKEIFLLSRKEFLSNDEIAKKLGISKRTIENQITRALKHLRSSMKDVMIYLIIIEGIKKMNL